MLAAISTATRSIYLEMYIFESDTDGYDFLTELEHKAQAGIRVVVILDALGSFALATAAIERLRNAGAEVLFFSYWFRRTHRKVLIVDESTVFLGGVNISGKFAPWRDLQMRLSGKHIARVALRSFADMYRESGGKNPMPGARRRPPLLKRTRLWFIEHGISGKRTALRKYYEEHIDSAKQSIVLVTPYLIPGRFLIAHIHLALMRGIQVDVIVPQHTDHPVVDHINEYYCTLLSQLGARCYLSPQMNHAKAMLIDHREGTVGSHNLDALSFNWNVEASVFFDDPNMVEDLDKIISGWKNEAIIFHPEEHALRWYDAFPALLLRLFLSVL